jgi:hypothetical protein
MNSPRKNLPQIMNLHDHSLRMLQRNYYRQDEGNKWKQSAEFIRMEASTQQMRPSWYEDKTERGRMLIREHIEALKQNPDFTGNIPESPTTTFYPWSYITRYEYFNNDVYGTMCP